MFVVVGSAVAVLVVIGVIVGIGLASHVKKASTTASDRTPVPAAALAAVTSVPASTLTAVGKGSVLALPQPINAAPVTVAGKPKVLYVGAEYCPYCAAERWAMVQALSRFGSFTGLSATRSSPRDVFPNTPTFSFHGATYTSDYLTFSGKEIQSNTIVGNSYAPLDTLTPDEQNLFATYSDNQAFPFVDLGGRYVVTGLQYDIKVLQGLTLAKISLALADPSSPVAKAIDGTANTLTAALCQLTEGKPGAVCVNPAVALLRGKLDG